MHGRVDTSRLENRDSDQIERRQDMTTNSRMTSTIRRGKINGKQTGGPPLSEAEHFWKCGWFDMRDLGQMLAHVHDAEIEICKGPGPPRQGPLH